MTDAKDIVFLESDVEENDPNAPVGKQIQFNEKGEVVEKNVDDEYYESYIMTDDDFDESDEVAIDEDGEYDPDIPDPEEDPNAPKKEDKPAQPEFIDLGDEDIDDEDFEEDQAEEIEEDEVEEIEDEAIEEIEDIEEIEEVEEVEEVEEELEVEEEPIVEEVEPSITFTVPMIKEYVDSMTGDIHPVATENKDANGENGPVSNNVGVCNMSLTYGKEEVSSLLIRLDEESANKYMDAHSIEASGFAGSGDYYKIPVNNGSFKEEAELWEIMEASYAYIISKYFKVDEDGQYVAIEEEPEVEEEPVVEEEPAQEPEPVVVAPVVEEDTSIKFTVPMVKEYVAAMTGENHPVATENKDANGENGPVSNNVGVCNMALTYGKDLVSSLLIRLDAESAIKYMILHTGEASNFAKSGDYYKFNINDKSYQDEAELKEILEASYAYIISKYFKVDEDGQYVAIEEPEEISDEDKELADITEKSLKESLAIAATVEAPTHFSKKSIADSLTERHGENVEINQRENRTANGLLPLADTHYTFDKDNKKKKVCFTYVYEEENGTVLLLIKTTKAHVKALKNDHPNVVNFSKFPKTKENDWYSVVLDDSFTQKDVDDMYDQIIGQISGTVATEEPVEFKEMTLKESLAIAAEQTVKVDFSKKFIADNLKARYGKDVEINERENRTSNGLLPLADTHYTFDKENAKKKVCFTYVYEEENGTVLLLIKTSKDHAKKLSKSHKNVNFSKFPKTKENDWYSVVLDDSFTQKDVEDMYDEIINNISNKKASGTAPAVVAAPAKTKDAKLVDQEENKSKKATKAITDNLTKKATEDAYQPAPEKKKAAPKKVTVVDEDSLWSVATITNKKEKQIKETNKEEKATEEKAPVKKTTKKAAAPVTEKETMAEKKEVKKAAAPAKEEKKAPAKAAKVAPAPKEEVKKEPAKKAAPAKKEEPKETLIQDADLNANPNPGKFVIKKTDKGNFVYKLFSANKRVVAIGAEPYTGLPAAKAGINSVIKNAESAPIEDQTLKKVTEQKCPKWIVFMDKKEEFRLRLIASNGNIVATTNDGYTTKAAAIEGIKAIGRAAKGAFIVRNDDLW